MTDTSQAERPVHAGEPSAYGDDAPACEAALRTVELFDELTDEQFSWLASVTRPRRLVDGETLFSDGDPGTHFYVLVQGDLVVSKVVDGRDEVLTRHSAAPQPSDGHDGKPAVAHRFTGELPLLTDSGYVATARAAGDTLVFGYTKADFLAMLTRCTGVARTLLPVLAWRIKSSELQARQRATLTGLGTLAAGLAHELNNPTAAVARVADQLGEAIGRLDRSALDWGAAAGPDARDALEGAVRDALDAPPPADADPIAVADAEDRLSDWAADHGAGDPELLASALAELGLDEEWLADRVAAVPDALRGAALDRLGALLTARSLTGELRAAAPRISALINATRDYTNLDRAPRQTFSVTEGLEATLTMLRPKLAAVRVLREYAPDLPHAMGYPTELNQVWTNVIDNAVDAMGGSGTLTLRARSDGHCVDVEIQDSGPGIPESVLPRIFEPFYTTKDVGKGTGLGLHLAYRIVTQRHHGSMTVRSVPGETRMTVRFPIREVACRP